MKLNQLATLVLRLMAVYLLIQSIPLLGMWSGLVTMARHTEGTSIADAWISALMPGLSMLIAGVLLLMFAVSIGKKLTPVEAADIEFKAVPFPEVQVLAFAIAGLLIFIDALPLLIPSIEYFGSCLRTANGEGRSELSRNPVYVVREFSAALGTLVKAALGLWLFFGVRGFVNMFRFLRVVGTPKALPDVPLA